MSLLFESFYLDVLSILIALLCILVAYFKYSFGYWSRRGVYSVPAEFPFGNFKDVFLQTKTMGECFQDLYKHFKSKGLRFGGCYIYSEKQLLLVDPDLIKAVMAKNFSHFSDRASVSNEEKEPLTGHLLSLSGNKWKVMRAKLSPTFTSGKIKMMFYTILACADGLEGVLNEYVECNKDIDMKQVLGRYTMDIIGSCAFGLNCNSLKDSDSIFCNYVRKFTSPTAKITFKRIFLKLFPNLFYCLKLRIFDKDLTDFITSVVAEAIEYREKNKIQRNDFLQLLINIKNTGDVDAKVGNRHSKGYKNGFKNIETNGYTNGYSNGGLNGQLNEIRNINASKTANEELNGHVNEADGHTNLQTDGHPNGQANVHTNGQTNGNINLQANVHSNGQVNRHVNGQANGNINGQANGYKYGQINSNINEQVNGHINGQAYGHRNGQISGNIDGKADGQTNGKANGHTNAWANEHMNDLANGLTMNEITAQCLIFFLAGFETSSTTMTFFLYDISQNPDVQEKVRKEINDMLKRYDGKMTYDGIMELHYLHKALCETLRLHAFVPFLDRRCTKDYKIPDSDVVIEKGTTVYIPVYGLQSDPEHYPEPDKYDPERFSREEKAKRHAYTFLPFGEGPRICIGQRFALLETKVGLVNLLKNHKFKVSKRTKVPLRIDPKAFQIFQPIGGIWLNAERIPTQE